MNALPPATLRLFGGYPPAELVQPRYRAFLLERVLEEGDRADLRWLTAEVAEAELRDFFRNEAGRRLSARSRAFWSLVLGEPLPPPPAAGSAESPSAIWPLA